MIAADNASVTTMLRTGQADQARCLEIAKRTVISAQSTRNTLTAARNCAYNDPNLYAGLISGWPRPRLASVTRAPWLNREMRMKMHVCSSKLILSGAVFAAALMGIRAPGA